MNGHSALLTAMFFGRMAFDGVMLKIDWFPCTVQQLNPNQCTKSIQIVANQ